MRLLATVLAWLLATAALAVAMPVVWAQHDLVDRDGYSALAAGAAREPALQDAVASLLTSELMKLAANSGYDVNEDLFRGAAHAYTAGSAFPGQFALANQVVHRWMFTDTVGQSDASGRWTIDLSPMLADGSFQQTLSSFGIKAPQTLQVPLTENVSQSLRPGQLRRLTTWGPWVSVGAAVVTAVFALLTFAAARRRGKAVVALGVSALIVGAAGWAAIEVGRRYVDRGLGATTGDVRNVAEAMVAHGIGSMHLWLNYLLAAGGGLVVFGVLVSVLGGLRRRD